MYTNSSLFSRSFFRWSLVLLGAVAGAVYVVGQGELAPTPGFYNQPVTVTLPDGVRYTLDGSTPSAKSMAYSEPLYLEATTVVRYARFSPAGTQEGFVNGGSYLIVEPETRLLTLSIGVDGWRLFNATNGWFKPGPGADPGHWKQPGANWWTRREHPVHLDLIETGGEVVHSSTVGLRMFGGMSRLHPQKSFSLSARKKYGKKRIKHRLFDQDDPKSFQFLVVRNAGSDWNRSYLRDALLTDLLQDESWDLDHQAARPVQVYLNGKYWGVYHLREKINTQFLADRHDIEDKDQIDLLEHQQTVKNGRYGGYQKLLRFVEQADLSTAANYQKLGELMDIPNFQRLQIAQTYFDNRDAGGNIRYWRNRADPTSKWRWILYDVDQGFGLHSDSAYLRNTLAFYTEANGPSWPNPPWSTFLQRRLLTNPDYRLTFANRFLDYLNTDFAPETVDIAIQRHVSRLEYDMPRQLERWRGKDNNWRLHLGRLRDFARHRPQHLRDHLREFFDGGADVMVTITAGPGGYVELNDNLKIDEESFVGSYLQNLPLHLRPRPHPGFRFLGWEDHSGTDLTLSLRDGKPKKLHATFEPAEHPLAGQIILNEICPRANSSGDWVELFNRSEQTVDLTGWQLSDGKHLTPLPAAQIAPNDYLVICRAPLRFLRTYPGAYNVVAGLDFGLDKSGETLGLYGPDGAYVNTVSYAVETPDSSFVVALVRPGLDNEDARHWAVKSGLGTPCAANP
ncbi:MAG: CotH kinase family protein, partial [Bacteroidota bacterium]